MRVHCLSQPLDLALELGGILCLLMGGDFVENVFRAEQV